MGTNVFFKNTEIGDFLGAHRPTPISCEFHPLNIHLLVLIFDMARRLNSPDIWICSKKFGNCHPRLRNRVFDFF
jgi:hypothetical protein